MKIFFLHASQNDLSSLYYIFFRISGLFVMRRRARTDGNGRMSLFDFLGTFREPEDAVQFALARGLLKGSVPCVDCRSSDRVSLHRNSDSPDGFAFQCLNCNKHFSVRHGTFFSRSRLSISDILTIILAFTNDYSLQQIRELTGLCTPAITYWYLFCREVCAHALNKNLVLGGPGIKVEISDTIMFERKSHQVANAVEYRFLGGYCVEQKRGFLASIETRDKVAMMSLVNMYIAPGSMIRGAASIKYRDLPYDEFPYHIDIDSENSRRPEQNLGSPGVASFWSAVLRRVRFTQDSQGTHTVQRVIEAVYKHNFRFNSRMSFHKRFSLFVDHMHDFCSANKTD